MCYSARKMHAHVHTSTARPLLSSVHTVTPCISCRAVWCVTNSMSSSVCTCNTVADFNFLCQVPAVDAQSCAAELHHALAKNDYQQASSLIRLAPHPGVFEMVNKQQQNALHLAGKQHWQLALKYNTARAPYPDASYACLLTCWLLAYLSTWQCIHLPLILA